MPSGWYPHFLCSYAMHEMGLASRKPYRKCARVVGEVCMKELLYHWWFEAYIPLLLYHAVGLFYFAVAHKTLYCTNNTLTLTAPLRPLEASPSWYDQDLKKLKTKYLSFIHERESNIFQFQNRSVDHFFLLCYYCGDGLKGFCFFGVSVW